MKLETAIKLLKKECKFLGVNWGDLEHLLQEQPTTFSEKVVKAYKTYRAHHPKIAGLLEK